MLATTKRDRSIVEWAYQNWLDSEIYDIEDAYRTRPSYAKIKAFRDICCEAVSRHSYNVRIVNHSAFTFTCGYTYKDSNGEEIFVYELPTRTLQLPVSEILGG